MDEGGFEKLANASCVCDTSAFYQPLLHTYDITIGKFIYTGCVTIVILHGPSGN